MAEITISEALKEIETIGKRLAVKKQSVVRFVVRAAQLKDPLDKDGGAVKFVAQERQAVGDLEKRIVTLRTGIQDSNLETDLTVQGTTQTVAEWLTWRKEVSAERQNFLQLMATTIQVARQQAQPRGGRVADEKEALPQDVIVHLDEKALLAELEQIQTTLGELDGKLSVSNATRTIEI